MHSVTEAAPTLQTERVYVALISATLTDSSVRSSRRHEVTTGHPPYQTPPRYALLMGSTGIRNSIGENPSQIGGVFLASPDSPRRQTRRQRRLVCRGRRLAFRGRCLGRRVVEERPPHLGSTGHQDLCGEATLPGDPADSSKPAGPPRRRPLRLDTDRRRPLSAARTD